MSNKNLNLPQGVIGRQVLESEGHPSLAEEAQRARQYGLVEVALADLEQVDRKGRRFTHHGELLRLNESLPFQPGWNASHFAVGSTQLLYFSSRATPVTETILAQWFTAGQVTPAGIVPVKQAGVYNSDAVWTQPPEGA